MRIKRPTRSVVIAIVLMTVGLAGAGHNLIKTSARSAPAAAITAAQGAYVTFRIPTITCAEDPLRVEASARKAPGILRIVFDGQSTTVTYDPQQVSPPQIAAAIAAGGDTVQPGGV